MEQHGERHHGLAGSAAAHDSVIAGWMRVLSTGLGLAAALGALGGCGGDEPQAVQLPPVAAVEIIAPETLLVVGGELELSAVARDSLGGQVKVAGFEWWSTDSAVARVRRGVVTGISAGQARIIVRPFETYRADTLGVGVVPVGTVRWKYAPGERFPVEGGPALSTDRTVVYVFTWRLLGATGHLRALDARTGRLVWAAPLDQADSNYPLVGPDGTIYLAARRVYAVSPSGHIRWAYQTKREYEIGGEISAAVSSSGDTVYVAAGPHVVALDARTGRELWETPGDGTSRWLVPPTVGRDGRLYVPHAEGDFVALDLNTGKVLWRVRELELGLVDRRHFGHGPVVVGDTIYLPLRRRLDAYRSADGKHLWSALVNGNGYAEPVVDSRRKLLYVQTSRFEGLTALKPYGGEAWNSHQRGQRIGLSPIFKGGPALAEDGTLYVAGAEAFWALNAELPGQFIRWRYPPTAKDTVWFYGAPLIGRDGTVYTFSEDTLFAFWASSKLDRTSPWPMWRHDPQRSGVAAR